MKWNHWLPAPQQMSDAVQLRRHAYTNLTMQQAMGMIVVLGFMAGILPFVENWILAARLNTPLPLAQAARSIMEMEQAFPDLLIGVPGMAPTAFSDFLLTVAGMEQPLPGWLAAGLSALGEWLNWPLHWLTIWIVYGALVMSASKLFGAHTTLQRFYAATGYASVPLLLTGLRPVPCLGTLASLVGFVWAVAVYTRATAEVNQLSPMQAVAAVFLPLAVLILLSMVLLGGTLLSTLLLTF